MEAVEVSKPIPEPSPSKGVAKKGVITVLFCVKGEKTVACVMCVCVCVCAYIKCAICDDVWGVGCVQLCVTNYMHVTCDVCMDQSYFDGPSAIKYGSHIVTARLTIA